MLAVHLEWADVQNREVGRKLLEERATAGIPHLREEEEKKHDEEEEEKKKEGWEGERKMR